MIGQDENAMQPIRRVGAHQRRSRRAALLCMECSFPHAGGAEPSQCCAEQCVEGWLHQRWFALQLLERGTHLCLAKAEVAQRREDLRANLERLRLHAATVFAAVGMSDAQSTRFVSIDGDLAAMGSAVVRSALCRVRFYAAYAIWRRHFCGERHDFCATYAA